MRDMIKLFVAVALFSVVAGGLLASVREVTKDRIEIQQLTFVKGPALNQILEGCTNNPLNDRFKLTENGKVIDFFVAEFNGKKNTVAFETYGNGYGGDIGVMVAVNLDTDEIVGIGVTTHSETPGVGARAKTDPTFAAQFKGLSINDPFKVRSDGGQLDAISGATITSRGVCQAVTAASEIYKQLKSEILNNIQA